MPRRFDSNPAVWWAWACAAILGSGACTLLVDDPERVRVLGYTLGGIYPALLLSGALLFARRRVPIWLLPVAASIGAARGVASLSGAYDLAQLPALVIEPVLVLAAAGFVGSSVRGSRSSLPELALVPVLLLLAGLEAATHAALLDGGPMPGGLVMGWVGGAPLLLALQIAACRRTEQRELEAAQQELEHRLAKQTERYRAISELGSDYAFSFRIDPDGRIEVEWVTDAFKRITGYDSDELDDRDWLNLVHPSDRKRIRNLAGDIIVGRVDRLFLRLITRDEETRWLNVHFRKLSDSSDGSVRLLGAARDVTDLVRGEEERRRLDRNMREMQRLESLGRLAGGIAHDFNNLLTVILGNARLLLEEGSQESPGRQRLGRIQGAARYAADLTDQIMTYSGQAELALVPLDLGQLVHEIAQLLEASVGKHVDLETDLPDDLPAVNGDVTRLRQVVLNLVTNATEAHTAEGGVVRVCCRERLVAEDEFQDTFGSADRKPGPYVVLEVTDTGVGLDPTLRSRIFEPFFSTKASGRGHGLAAVLGIVTAHGGHIQVESALGVGTTFRVFLPRSSELALVQPAQSSALPAPSGEGRCVLLVDDDEAVLEVGCAFLERAGFRVLTASGGFAALEVFRREGAAVDVVVLDLAMPDLSGEETFEALRALRADVPVVLVSGYDRKQAAERFRTRGIEDFVRKPYEPDELTGSVVRALGRNKQDERPEEGRDASASRVSSSSSIRKPPSSL